MGVGGERVTAGELTDALRETLSCFERGGAPRTTTEVAESLDLGRRSTYDRLDRLEAAGRVETKKVGANARVWWRSSTDAEERTPESADETSTGSDETNGGETNGDETEPSGGAATGQGRERKRYETVVETVQDGIYVVDEDGYFVSVNEAYESMVGRSREDLVGEHVSEVVDEDVLDEAKRLEEALAAGDQDTASLEATFGGGDGGEIVGEATFALMEVEGGHERVGVVRDVSDRAEFEQTLTGLYTSAREFLGTEARGEVSDVVVDTATGELGLQTVVMYAPGEAGDSLTPVAGVVGGDHSFGDFSSVPVNESNLVADSFETGAAARVESLTELACWPVSGAQSQSGLVEPVGDHGVILVAGGAGEDVDGKTRQLVELLATNAEAAYDSVQRDRTVKAQRERLAALNELNDVFRGITRAIIGKSTREAIERVVCERLAAADSYQFAWIGDVNVADETVELREKAGVSGYLDDVTISVDPDSDLSGGPTGRALRTGETQTTRRVAADDQYEPWREYADEYDFTASAAVPIVHENTVYGVLNVYTSRRDAFEDQERAVVSQLGRIVGHAISATERKRALLGDEVVEVEFRIEDVFADLDVPDSEHGPIRMEGVVPLGDGEFVVYGTASTDARSHVEALAESLPHWTGVTFSDGEEEAGLELRLSDPPVLTAVASLGGSVEEAVFEGGDYRMALHISPSMDVENVSSIVHDAYPSAELVAHRQISRTHYTADRIQAVLDESLTDRQHTALRAAHHSGFFGWPREVSGEELAASLDVAAPTFFQHLRKAEAKVFDELFATDASNVTPAGDDS